MAMSENRRIAEEVIEAVGGRENISSVAHCATRLRIMVNDKELIDQKRVEGIQKVKGAFFNSGQYQIIFGTGTVNRVYEEVAGLGLATMNASDQKKEAAKSGTRFQRAIRTFGDVFVPIIPVLVATGLFMGLRGLLMQEQILGLFGLAPDGCICKLPPIHGSIDGHGLYILAGTYSLVDIPSVWRKSDNRFGAWPDACFALPAECLVCCGRRSGPN